MIINHEHRFVFVQVPDSASTAVGRELCERYGGQPILDKHSHLAELHETTGGEYRDYFVFGTIRHPLEIMVARYFKLKGNRGGIFTDPKHWAENGGRVSAGQLERFRFVQRPESDFPSYFLRYAPRLYESPYYNGVLDRFDRVLRRETLDGDFQEALAEVGIAADREIPPKNVNPVRRAHFSDYYTEETRKRARISFGPFMRAWEFAFPADWQDIRVPHRATLEYEIGRFVGRFCAHRLNWSSERALEARDQTRRRLRRLTRRWKPV